MGRARSRRRRGKTGGVGSSRSKSKSNKSKSTGGSRGRSNNTRGGQSKANKNQNKKARSNRTINSIKKAVGASFKGAAANAASAVANSSLASKYNRKTRDMSKITPQSRRRYERLSQKTGRDYSKRDPTMRINLSADRLAQFAGVSDKGWYKGLTNRFPGIRKLQINKQLYSNPMKKGWHSSQRTGRGQGISSVAESMIGGQQQRRAAQAETQQQNQAVKRQNDYNVAQYESAKSQMGPQQDWLGDLYSTHNISGGKLDQGARDYWSNEAKTKGRDAVMQSIIGTSKAQGTYGGRIPMTRSIPASHGYSNLQNKGAKRRMAKSLAAHMAAIRGI